MTARAAQEINTKEEDRGINYVGAEAIETGPTLHRGLLHGRWSASSCGMGKVVTATYPHCPGELPQTGFKWKTPKNRGAAALCVTQFPLVPRAQVHSRMTGADGLGTSEIVCVTLWWKRQGMRSRVDFPKLASMSSNTTGNFQRGFTYSASLFLVSSLSPVFTVLNQSRK